MVLLMLLFLHLQANAINIIRNQNIDLRLETNNNSSKQFRQEIISTIINGHTTDESNFPFYVRLVYRQSQC